MDDDNNRSAVTPPTPTDLLSKLGPLKRQLDDKSQEVECLKKSLDKVRKETECAFMVAVSLQNAHDAMEREMAELKRRQLEGGPDKVDLVAQELKSQQQELQRLRGELDALRKENATRQARIADLERQLSDAGREECNAEESCNNERTRKASRTTVAENDLIHVDTSGLPNITLLHGDAGNLLDDNTLERVVNTLALFAKKSVLLFGGHHFILENKLIVWGYEWPNEGVRAPMEFIPSVSGRDSWYDSCRTLRCRVNDLVRPVVAEFTCPDPNEVFRVYYKEPTLNADDYMQHLYAHMVSVFMKNEVCSLPMTVYVFATVAMILAPDKAHFSAFVSRVYKCKSCADLLMHLSQRFWAEDRLHTDVVHWTFQRRPATVKQEVCIINKLDFPKADTTGLKTASEAEASNGPTAPAQCAEPIAANTPPPASQQNERLLSNARPQTGFTPHAGDDRFDEAGRYRMDRFEKQGPCLRHQNENAASTKDPSKIWTIAIPRGYTAPDFRMLGVLDVLTDRIPRLIKYEDFLVIFNHVSQQLSPKRFLSSLASKRDAAMLLECFKCFYEQTEESFASFLYCKIVLSRT
ncbi:hypothetical protein AAVH_24825 [Aphelenchoides avenae]|nr:hypothetical protein AAVH_24825 [Aphelenchus avenae]